MSDKLHATIGILTALPKECAAVRCMLEGEVRGPARGKAKTSKHSYYVGRMPADGGGSHVVVVALLPDMGNNSAAITATRLLADFKGVQHLIMCGIAGGVPRPGDTEHDVRLGDIVVSDRGGVVQYDLIKKRPDASKEHRHPPRPPGAALLGAVGHLRTEEERGSRPWKALLALGKIKGGKRPADDRNARGDVISYPPDSGRTAGQPRVFHGTIASANILLKNPAHRDYLGKTFSVKAIEMEGSGVADATWADGFGYLVVRGICDYCDDKKGDVWQGAAAVAAAAYTRTVIASMPAPGARPRRSPSGTTAKQPAPSPPGKTAKQSAPSPRRKKPALGSTSKPGSHPTEPIARSSRGPQSRLRVLVLHGPDNAAKHEVLAWLRSQDVGADARTVGEMEPSARHTVDDRVDMGIEWADKFIALVTPDKRSPSGAPNVIDEIGRIRGQGRSSDLAIVRQRTCKELWSNLAGVVRIEFDQRVKEAMLALAKFLGVLGSGAPWVLAPASAVAPLAKARTAATKVPTSKAAKPQRPPVPDAPSQALWTWLEQRLRGAPEATRLLATSQALAEHLEPTRRRGSGAAMRPAVRGVTGIDLPAVVANALLAVDARIVASALNDAHDAAEGPARAVLGEVLFHVLPFAIDLGEVRRRASEAIQRNEQSVELPFRTETLAEIVSAGVDGRPVEVLSTGAFPAGVASMALPATGYAPLFARQNDVFVQDVAIQLCREDGPANEQFVELKRRLVKDPTKRSIASLEELRRTVQVLLRSLAKRPRYLLFIDQDLEAEGEKDVDHLWGLVRGAVEDKQRGLDGLRLIRLRGGVDEVAGEYSIALHIRQVKNRR